MRTLVFIFSLSGFAACVGPTAPPALLLQLSHVTRVRAADSQRDRTQQWTVSAAFELAIDRVPLPMIRDPVPVTPVQPDIIPCEPEAPALCTWADAAEEAAWLAALEHTEASP
jgi:hypothetical protein